MITCLHQFLGLGHNYSHLGHFVPGFICFLIFGGIMDQNLKNELLYWAVHNSYREDNNNE